MNEQISPPWLKWFLLALAIIILGSIAILNPFWGLMDDASHIYGLVPAMETNGLLAEAWAYAHGDLSWGMFRPVYPLMVYALYKPGILLGPALSFLLNALFTLGVFTWLARILGRLLKVSWLEILLVCAAFFYALDLFQHISLQEKLVLLAAALLFRVTTMAERWPSWLYSLCLALVIVFGVLTKASFLIYLCAGFFIFLDVNRRRLFSFSAGAWAQLFFIVLLSLGSVAAFYYISKHGTYTQRYSFANVLPNLASVEGLMFLLPIVLALVHIFRHWSFFRAHPAQLVPLVGVSAFLLLFAPWAIQAYIQTVITPLFACLLLQVAAWYGLNRWRFAWLPLLAAMALLVTSYRSVTMFLRLSDLRKVVAMAPVLEGQGATRLWMPCQEGTEAMEKFMRATTGSSPKIEFRTQFSGLDGTVALYDQATCPLPGRVVVPNGCVADVLFRGSFEKSFRIVRLRCT